MIFDLYDLGHDGIDSVRSSQYHGPWVASAMHRAAPEGLPGVQHTNWLDILRREACGSCHDDIDFVTGEGHIIQTTDGSCHYCHAPIDGEFDLSVKGAHTPLLQVMRNSGGILFKFIEVTNTNPGDKPTVIFSVGGKNGNTILDESIA